MTEMIGIEEDELKKIIKRLEDLYDLLRNVIDSLNNNTILIDNFKR